jgi:L,D-transpeptidase catalytic domain/Oxidoreductase molybdopterin binding domain
MAKQDQITTHFCIQGWSGVAKWGGVPMREILGLVKPMPEAGYAVFYSLADGADGGRYYDVHKIDNMRHALTILAYEMNGAPVSVLHGASLRLRCENNHYLYRVEDGGRATRYGVGVGREGFWYGEATIKSKQEWPDWYPPKEMMDRRSDLKKSMVALQSGEGMHGGPANPLGARAMYLWQGNHDTYFRIHGTNEPWTIRSSQSSGCIRMINQDAMDLYQKTPVGTRVVVLASPGAPRV